MGKLKIWECFPISFSLAETLRKELRVNPLFALSISKDLYIKETKNESFWCCIFHVVFYQFVDQSIRVHWFTTPIMSQWILVAIWLNCISPLLLLDFLYHKLLLLFILYIMMFWDEGVSHREREGAVGLLSWLFMWFVHYVCGLLLRHLLGWCGLFSWTFGG